MYEPSTGEQILRDTFIVILMFSIVVGNTLIIAAYIKNFRVRTSTNVFIVGLALSDWLVGAIAVPFYIVTLRTEGYNALLIRFYIALDIFSGTASVFHLVFVTVERYVAVSKPFLHGRLSIDFYYSVLGVVWILSLFLSCLDFSLTSSVSEKYPFYVLLIVFFLALLVISLLNALIFKIARSLVRNTVEPAPLVELQLEDRTRASLRRKLRRERRTATTLAMFCGVFFVTWLPHVTSVLVFKFCFPCDLAPVDIGRVGAFVKCMQYSNSALNPFLFAFRDAEINKTITSLVSGCWNFVQPYATFLSSIAATSTLTN